MRRRTLQALVSMVAAFLLSAEFSAQSINPDSHATVAGRIAFDVTSVKQNASGGGSFENVPYGGDETPVPGGLYIGTNRSLPAYIWFAYKLNIVQARALDSELPKWALNERFDIQGRGPANATVGQLRLMLQSLLTDRFDLKAHFVTREGRVYALVLLKPGITGPKLVPHSDNPPCPGVSDPKPNPFSSTPDGFPTICGQVVGMANGSGSSYAGRDISMATLAANLAVTPNTSLDRPVVDHTGLTGNFDFVVKFAFQPTNAANPVPEDYQAAFLEALRDQLGLKLAPTTGPVETFVIDHIEEPSPN